MKKRNSKDANWRGALLTVCVAILIAITSGLVISTIGIVFHQHKVAKANEEIASKIDNLVKDEQSADIQSIKEVLEAETEVLRAKTLQMDETNFIAILLALITLCATLAVVIPYVTGKSLIVEEVRGQTSQLKADIENINYNILGSTANEMNWSEGHTSRMIAYLLLQHPDAKNLMWAIGWGAKAYSKYSTITEKTNAKNLQLNVFKGDCLDYMKKAVENIYAIEKENTEGKVIECLDSDLKLRTLKDLYVAIRYETTNGHVNGVKELKDFAVKLVLDMQRQCIENARKKTSKKEQQIELNKWRDKIKQIQKMCEKYRLDELSYSPDKFVSVFMSNLDIPNLDVELNEIPDDK